MRREIQFWRWALHISESTLLCSDVSFLWAREWSLEMSTPKTNVFPLSDSLLYVAVMGIIESAPVHYGKDALPLLDGFNAAIAVYNDAATIALGTWQSQVIYKELSVEVRVVVESVVISVAEYLFRHAKCAAAAMVLPETLREAKEESRKKKKSAKPKPVSMDGAQGLNRAVMYGWHVERLGTLLSVPCFTILGQKLSLHSAVCEHLHNLFTDDVFSLFNKSHQMSPSRFVTEAEMMFLVWQRARDLLDQPSFHLYLDPWNTIWDGLCIGSMPFLHTCWALIRSVVVESYIFNIATQRFVTREKIDPEQFPPEPVVFFANSEMRHSFAAFYERRAQFFGIEHLQGILRVLGREEGVVSFGLALQSDLRVLIQGMTQAVNDVAAGGPPNDALLLHQQVGNLLCLASLIDHAVLGSALSILATAALDSGISKEKYVGVVVPLSGVWEVAGGGFVWATAAMLRALDAVAVYEFCTTSQPQTPVVDRFRVALSSVLTVTVMNAMGGLSKTGQTPTLEDLLKEGLVPKSEPRDAFM